MLRFKSALYLCVLLFIFLPPMPSFTPSSFFFFFIPHYPSTPPSTASPQSFPLTSPFFILPLIPNFNYFKHSLASTIFTPHSSTTIISKCENLSTNFIICFSFLIVGLTLTWSPFKLHSNKGLSIGVLLDNIGGSFS